MTINPHAPATLHTDYESATWTTGTTTGAMAKPAGLADGDVLWAALYDQVAASTWPTRPTGFTEAYHTTAASTRGLAANWKPIASAAGEPSTYTFGSSNSGRGCALLFRVSGEDNTTPVDAVPASDVANTGAGNSIVIPSVTAVSASAYRVIQVYANGTGAVTYTFSAPGCTVLATNNVNNAGSTSSLAVLVQQLSSSGATGTITVTCAPSDSVTAAASSGGFQMTMTAAPVAASGTASLTLTGAGSLGNTGTAALTLTGTGNGGAAAGGTASLTLTANQTTLLQQWLLTERNIVHRGGDADWPEDTAFAYASAVAWNSRAGLECSVWPTSDGFYMLNDAATTGAAWNSNLTIASSTRATLQGLRSLADATKPPMFYDDFLSLYAGVRPIWLDNKSNTNNSTVLGLAIAAGCNPGNLVGKSFGPSSSTWIAYCNSQGFPTWGYFYDTDVPTNLATYQGNYTYLGLQYDSTGPHWTTALSYGKLIFAHTIATATQAATAISNGASGLMVSGVREVITNDSGTATASLTLTASGAGKAASSGTAALTLTASGAAAAPVTGTASLTLTGAGADKAAASGTASLTFTGSGTAKAAAAGSAALSLTATGTAATTAAGTAALTLTGSGADQAPVTATAALTLTATGADAAAASGTAALTFTATGATGGTLPASGTATLTLTATGSDTAVGAGAAALTLTASGQGRSLAGGVAALTLAAFAAAIARGAGTASITFTATGIASGGGGTPAGPTPPERTTAVRAENRTATAPAADVAASVDGEDRTTIVPAESRTVTV